MCTCVDGHALTVQWEILVHPLVFSVDVFFGPRTPVRFEPPMLMRDERKKTAPLYGFTSAEVASKECVGCRQRNSVKEFQTLHFKIGSIEQVHECLLLAAPSTKNTTRKVLSRAPEARAKKTWNLDTTTW